MSIMLMVKDARVFLRLGHVPPLVVNSNGATLVWCHEVRISHIPSARNYGLHSWRMNCGRLDGVICCRLCFMSCRVVS